MSSEGDAESDREMDIEEEDELDNDKKEGDDEPWQVKLEHHEEKNTRLEWIIIGYDRKNRTPAKKEEFSLNSIIINLWVKSKNHEERKVGRKTKKNNANEYNKKNLD